MRRELDRAPMTLARRMRTPRVLLCASQLENPVAGESRSAEREGGRLHAALGRIVRMTWRGSLSVQSRKPFIARLRDILL